MKINLDQEKSNAIAKLMAVGGAGVEALKELLLAAEAELRDVGNIDPKGNMGLQALAAQKAVETLKEIRSHLFPDTIAKTEKKPGERQISQFR